MVVLTPLLRTQGVCLGDCLIARDYTGMLGKVVMSRITKKKQLQKIENIAST